MVVFKKYFVCAMKRKTKCPAQMEVYISQPLAILKKIQTKHNHDPPESMRLNDNVKKASQGLVLCWYGTHTNT